MTIKDSELKIEEETRDGELLLSLTGRLNTNTAPQLQEVFDRIFLKKKLSIEQVKIDMEGLEYLSSAGLRTLLTGSKLVKGNLTVFHVNDEIMGVFKITGFDSILNIQ